MLFPRHPKPVVSRREVAAMVVAQQRRESVVPGHVILVQPAAPTATEAAPAPARIPRDPDMAPSA